MAKSKYEYVKKFELDDTLLPNTYFIIRVDGRSFHKFTSEHAFEKPNDLQGITLMNNAAQRVMVEFTDISLAYGQSDEYSFLFPPHCQLYQRRTSKLVSAVVSVFTAWYTKLWPGVMQKEMKGIASFDGRAVCYPTRQNVRDYFSWRQADCHINNLYNTCFWALVLQAKKTENEAQLILKDTVSADKNELLFSQFGINYNNVPEMYRKGSTLYRSKVAREETTASGKMVTRTRTEVVISHVDIIGDDFWNQNPVLPNE